MNDTLTIADLANRAPESFGALAAMHVGALFALRRGGLQHLQIETWRGSAPPLAEVAQLQLAADPRVAFTLGLHSHRKCRALLDPQTSAALIRKADKVDRQLHLRRYALWLAAAYPTLAHELLLACPPDQVARLKKFLGGDALQPLVDTLRLLSGAPSESASAASTTSESLSDGELLAYGSALVARNAAALEELLSDYLQSPVRALPPDGTGAHVRLLIGPLTWSGYVALLPLGERRGLRQLLDRVRLVAGVHADVELTLVVDRHALPTRHQSRELGFPRWTMFPARKGPPQNDPRVVIPAALCRATLHPRPAQESLEHVA